MLQAAHFKELLKHQNSGWMFQTAVFTGTVSHLCALLTHMVVSEQVTEIGKY